MLMLLPFVLFWVLILTGSEELGWKGVLIFVGVWVAVLAVVAALKIDRHFFIAAQAILDVVLVSTIL